MTAEVSLHERIASSEIDHPRFLQIRKAIQRRIEEAIRGEPPKTLMTVGPSRIGKSQLVESLKRLNPTKKVGNRTIAPVVFATVTTGTTPAQLPLDLLTALQVQVPPNRSKLRELNDLMRDSIKRVGCRATCYDEANHYVDAGARISARQIADWHKAEQDATGTWNFFFGIPKLLHMRPSNQQLRLRSLRPIIWLPYSATVSAEREIYVTCVNTFLEYFRRAKWTFEDDPEAIALNCYLHSPGLLGPLKDLMYELAKNLDEGPRRAIAFEDFAQAASVIESAGRPDLVPFVDRKVPPVYLGQAFKYVLQENEMGETKESER